MLFRRKRDTGPPDIGKEEVEYPELLGSENNEANGSGASEIGSVNYSDAAERVFQEVSKPAKGKSRKKPQTFQPEPEVPTARDYKTGALSRSEFRNGFELEKMNARLEVINSLISAFNERFSRINQQIGEIRAMAIANEKNLSISNLDARRVVDIVKEVNPEKLRVDYQKLDMRMNTLMEKMESYRLYMDSVMEELKELKRKANLFEGTDALLKLDEDVKKDLIQIQKTNARVKMNADKSEQIFIELSKEFNESRKMNEMMINLDASYSGLKKEIERLTLDYKQVMSIEDFADFKRRIGSKMAVLENSFSEIEKLKEETDNLSKGLGKLLLIERRNEEDIANLGLKGGNTDIQRISDYEQKLFSVLDVIENLTDEITRIKERLGIRSESASLSTAQGENMRQENERLMENERRINELITKGKQYMVGGDLTAAWRTYKDIFQLYNPVEDANRAMYYKIINFYDTLCELVNKPVVVAEKNSQSSQQNEPPKEQRKYKQLSDY